MDGPRSRHRSSSDSEEWRRNVRIATFGSWRPRTWAIAGGITVAAAMALLVALASPFARATTDPPTTCSAGTTVNTATGPVCGFVSNDGLTEWLGIPFAAPPLGALRWQPPQPPAVWTTTRSALQYPAPCEGNGPSSSEDRPVSERDRPAARQRYAFADARVDPRWRVPIWRLCRVSG